MSDPGKRSDSEIVTLRDIYTQGQDTQREVLKVSHEVQSLLAERDEQRKKNESLSNRIKKVELRLYQFTGGLAVLIFTVTNWNAIQAVVN